MEDEILTIREWCWRCNAVKEMREIVPEFYKCWAGCGNCLCISRPPPRGRVIGAITQETNFVTGEI